MKDTVNALKAVYLQRTLRDCELLAADDEEGGDSSSSLLMSQEFLTQWLYRFDERRTVELVATSVEAGNSACAVREPPRSIEPLKMFAKATRNFLKEIDPDGCLIPVSRLVNSDKLDILSLIIKRNPVVFWKKPKYMPSDFTLSHVLEGDPISPVVLESDFLKYEGTYANTAAGNLETGVGSTKIAMTGSGSCKLQSSFGNLKKQEVDVQKLLEATKDRLVNLEHSLVQQTRGKRNEVFGVLKEKIITTQRCSITEHCKGQGSCTGRLQIPCPRAVKVSVTENGDVDVDRNVSMEIVPRTVIAYSIIELEIKRDGRFELCLQPNTFGGFEEDTMEVDGPFKADTEGNERILTDVPLNTIDKYLEKLSAHFQQLSNLPAQDRFRLCGLLRKLLVDRCSISKLESVLGEMCQDEASDLGDLEESQCSKTLRAILDFLSANRGDHAHANGHRAMASSLHTSVYLLVSAMDELTDDALHLMEQVCEPPVLQALHLLVSHILSAGVCLLMEPHLSTLGDESTYLKVQFLLLSCGVILHRGEGRLWAETASQTGLLPLLISVLIRGLALLATEHRSL